jgi:hypothetical protein
MGDPSRCPTCGGLVAPDAEWCGQCYAPIVRAGSGPPTSVGSASRSPTAPGVGSGGGSVGVEGGRASWTCPVCDERNPIDAPACRTCQTPFARLFETPADRAEVDPSAATRWSLLFPGLGHWKAGLRFDAVARIVLFAWTLGTVLVILLSRPEAGGLGRATPILLLYAVAAAATYAESAVDARRAAAGADPLVPSRVLLWASAGLVIVSILLGMVVTFPAVRG